MRNKEKIEKAASAIYSKHYNRGVPAEILSKIILAEGIKLREIEGCNTFLGSLIKTPNDTFYIFVNKGIANAGRKNFTLAHELGHFVLEHHLQTSSLICNENDIAEGGGAMVSIEQEANYFASCFLLPRDRLVKEFTNWFVWHNGSDSKAFLHVNVKEKSYSNWKAVSSRLTKKFNVSTVALKIRLVEVGLINNFK